MRRRRPVVILAISSALAFAGCAYSLINGGKVNATHAGNVEQGIQGIRQLSFKHHVPVVLKTPDQVEQMVLADLHRDYSEAQLDADGKAGAMLGLYPPGIDLKGETVKLLKSQIAGFYDPHEKEMVLVEGATPVPISDRMLEFVVQRDLVDDMLLAHELTHALQDQNFALQDKLDAFKDNSDKEMALKSVAEGDATLAGFAYVAGRMDNSVADSLTASLKSLPETFAAQSKDTPEGLGYPLIFQYSEGVRFVGEAYKRGGGWKGVDALYAKPPQSTQQIIDPSLYFEDPLPPVDVKVAGYQPIRQRMDRSRRGYFRRTVDPDHPAARLRQGCFRSGAREEMGRRSNGDPRARHRHLGHLDRSFPRCRLGAQLSRCVWQAAGSHPRIDAASG